MVTDDTRKNRELAAGRRTAQRRCMPSRIATHEMFQEHVLEHGYPGVGPMLFCGWCQCSGRGGVSTGLAYIFCDSCRKGWALPRGITIDRCQATCPSCGDQGSLAERTLLGSWPGTKTQPYDYHRVIPDFAVKWSKPDAPKETA